MSSSVSIGLESTSILAQAVDYCLIAESESGEKIALAYASLAKVSD
jgi:hypothetical protein